MDGVKAVHTSALHLGRRFPNYESGAEKVRMGDIFRAFEQVLDHVVESGAHLLLVAGGLFDRLHPDRETVSFVLNGLGRINRKNPQARIVICPGEEEILVKAGGETECILSIFEHLPYVHVIGCGEKVDSVDVKVEGMEVKVASCRFDRFLEKDFRAKEAPACKKSFGIFLLNCHSRKQPGVELEEGLLRERVFAPMFGRGYRCFALGRPYGFRDLSTDEYAAVFPGSVERFDLGCDRDRKYFVEYRIASADAKPAVGAVQTGVRPVEYVSVTCAPGEKDLGSLVSKAAGAGDREAVLYIVLEGETGFGRFREFLGGEVLSALREKYAIVHLDNRLVLVDEGEEYRFGALHVGSPEDEFRRYMEGEIRQAKPGSPEQALLNELLEMGLKEIGENQ
ncbi:MAG: hypothetical protein AB1742_12030 [bacterium]